MRTVCTTLLLVAVAAGCSTSTAPPTPVAAAPANCLDRVSYDHDSAKTAAQTQAAAAKTYTAEAGFASEANIGASHRKPQALSIFPPDYPSCALSNGLEGNCDVFFNLDENGRAVDIIPVCTHGVFAREATRTIARSTYSPATINGEPVRFEGIVRPMKFRFERESTAAFSEP